MRDERTKQKGNSSCVVLEPGVRDNGMIPRDIVETTVGRKRTKRKDGDPVQKRKGLVSLGHSVVWAL